MSISSKILLSEVSVKVKEQTLIDNISLELLPNEIYTLIGPSGAGKSTLLYCLAGLKSLTTGKMLLGNEPYDPREHIISFVPQNYGLLPWQTAQKAVERSIKISQKKRKLTTEDQQKIATLFEQLQLSELKNKYPGELSGGQKQRVSLLCAFAVSSDLLLLDEPFSALDAFTRESIQKSFSASWEKNPVTTVFVTHDIEEALLLGHHIILMKDKPGEIKKVLPNPLRNIPLEKRRDTAEFYALVKQLKEEISHEK